MTTLQAYLRESYRRAWQKRNATAGDLCEMLHAAEEARVRLESQQKHLENMATLLREAGFDKCEDYFSRVWPLAMPEINPYPPSNIALE